jgi:NADPH:quinone reductase-like Zn-dependent oxidoreductase
VAIPDTMRAVVLNGHGDLDMLEYREGYPVPSPGPHEVLVAVSACGMNNTDVNTRVGWYAGGSWGGGIDFPRIQGADPVGTVAAVGERVSSERIGQRVMVDPWIRGHDVDHARYLGSELDGGFSEFVAVPSANAHRIDSALSDVELATFACSYSTAEHMLTRAELRAGQWVLVTGASGGVGGALIQLAKRRGARVVALTGPEKLDAVASIGADVVLDREGADVVTAVEVATGGVDVFADVVGGAWFPPLLGSVRRGGHYVVAGAVAGAVVELDLRTLYLHDLTMHGATVVPEEVFSNLLLYIERGEMQPRVDRVFPLQGLVDAQEYFMEGTHLGSVVIDMEKP